MVASALVVAYFRLAFLDASTRLAELQKELSICEASGAGASTNTNSVKLQHRILEIADASAPESILQDSQQLQGLVEKFKGQVRELEGQRMKLLELQKQQQQEQEQERFQQHGLVEALRSQLKELQGQKLKLQGQQQQLQEQRALQQDCPKSAPAVTPPDPYTLRNWKGYECEATQKDMDRYLNYTWGHVCPNDWFFVQKLIFKKNCFALPRRKCFSPTPTNPSEPLPFPESLFNQSSLKDENVRWDLHGCKSYGCLNARTKGDCRACFNLSLELGRWKSNNLGALKLEEVLSMKPGGLRLGLDVGGGTGSFAAQMALHGITVMTTSFNVETVGGKKSGLPYMESIAMRGLIPLHLPHKARMPFFDGALDIIHSMNSIKYLPLAEFEELLFEWNRVLRPGGLIWMEMFYAPKKVMPSYIKIIENLNYQKLYWKLLWKPYKSEKPGQHLYLHCVLEKRPTPGHDFLSRPKDEDMQLKLIP